jgi:hypothetical protein
MGCPRAMDLRAAIGQRCAGTAICSLLDRPRSKRRGAAGGPLEARLQSKQRCRRRPTACAHSSDACKRARSSAGGAAQVGELAMPRELPKAHPRSLALSVAVYAVELCLCEFASARCELESGLWRNDAAAVQAFTLWWRGGVARAAHWVHISTTWSGMRACRTRAAGRLPGRQLVPAATPSSTRRRRAPPAGPRRRVRSCNQ